MTTFNLLPYNDALLRTNEKNNTVTIGAYSTNWISSPNSQMIVTANNFAVDTRYVLAISPRDTSAVTLTLENVPLYVRDNGRVLSFNLKIRANSTFDVSASLFIDGDNSGIIPHQQTFSSGQYNAVQTNRVVVPDDDGPHTATISLVITNHQASTIFVTNPHLIHDLEFHANKFVGMMRNYFPDFYWELDSSNEYPTNPFFRLVDILSSAAGAVNAEFDAMYPAENAQLPTPGIQTEYWAQSNLVSPAAVKEEYIPWLSQFTGSLIRRNFEYGNGDVYFNNAALIRDFTEWQLRSSHYGRAAGTREAMIEAVQQVLVRTKDGESSTKSVALAPRYLGDPFTIRIQTLTNETIDASDGETSALVLKAVEPAKPLGYKVVHSAVDEFYFTWDDPSLGVLDNLRWG
jgi:hypothetical protein